jgi:hypothetical protein
MTGAILCQEVSERLRRIRLELGDTVSRAATRAALTAIARVVLAEAERRAKNGKTDEKGEVLRFPLSRAIRSTSDGGT